MENIDRRKAPVEAYQLLETIRLEVEQDNIPIQALQDLIKQYQKTRLDPGEYGCVIRELGQFPVSIRYTDAALMIKENGYGDANQIFFTHRNFIVPEANYGQEEKVSIEFLALTGDIRDLSSKKLIYHDDVLGKIQLVIAAHGYRPASFFELLALGGQHPDMLEKKCIGCLHPQYTFSNYPGIPRLQKGCAQKYLLGFSNYAYFCTIIGGQSRGVIAVVKAA